MTQFLYNLHGTFSVFQLKNKQTAKKAVQTKIQTIKISALIEIDYRNVIVSIEQFDSFELTIVLFLGLVSHSASIKQCSFIYEKKKLIIINQTITK